MKVLFSRRSVPCNVAMLGGVTADDVGTREKRKLAILGASCSIATGVRRKIIATAIRILFFCRWCSPTSLEQRLKCLRASNQSPSEENKNTLAMMLVTMLGRDRLHIILLNPEFTDMNFKFTFMFFHAHYFFQRH